MPLPKGLNENDLELVGEGVQGRVYRLNRWMCVKVYKRSKFFWRELNSLKRGSGAKIFPQIYEWGDSYIVRDYIPGISLVEHLKSEAFTKTIASQLLELYRTLERLQFKRLDTRLDHIIVTPEGDLRVIDPTNAMTKRQIFPKRMVAGLAKLGYDRLFLDYVTATDPELASRWGLPTNKSKKVTLP